MRHSTLLLLNTAASYTRIIVNAVVTLIATRVALKYLGADDFGLYNLIAGIVVLLSFINGSLMISSQRFFSISIGEGNEEKLGRYFNASLGIHIFTGLFIGLLLLAITPLLFNGFLNIPDGKESVAQMVYYIMVVSSVITVATIPFSAIMNAREDLMVLSLCDIMACIVKLLAAVCLMFLSSNLLLWYSVLMLGSVLVKMLMEIVWSRRRYKESKVIPSQLINKPIYQEMLGFIGWNTLGSVAVLVRNQGVAVVLNIFFGTVINAAYGIANQVNSLVLSFASTLTTVFTPMIIQAKGANDEKRMISTAIFSSKMSFLLSSAMALPILIFLPQILNIWLGKYPDGTLDFCRYIVLSFLVLQLYPGINRAIYATGKIKGYQISISIFLVAILPIGAWMFRQGYPSYSIMIVMLISQVFTLFSTVYYGHKFCHLNVAQFMFGSVFVPVALFIASLWACHTLNTALSLTPSALAIIIYSAIADILYAILFLTVVLSHSEKQSIRSLTNNIISHVKRNN